MTSWIANERHYRSLFQQNWEAFPGFSAINLISPLIKAMLNSESFMRVVANLKYFHDLMCRVATGTRCKILRPQTKSARTLHVHHQKLCHIKRCQLSCWCIFSDLSASRNLQFGSFIHLQKSPYRESVPDAQQMDPWNRLNRTPTLASARREIFHMDPQAPNDSLDFVIKAQYDHHKKFLSGNNVTLFQKETLTENHGYPLRQFLAYGRFYLKYQQRIKSFSQNITSLFFWPAL